MQGWVNRNFTNCARNDQLRDFGNCSTDMPDPIPLMVLLENVWILESPISTKYNNNWLKIFLIGYFLRLSIILILATLEVMKVAPYVIERCFLWTSSCISQVLVYAVRSLFFAGAPWIILHPCFSNRTFNVDTSSTLDDTVFPLIRFESSKPTLIMSAPQPAALMWSLKFSEPMIITPQLDCDGSWEMRYFSKPSENIIPHLTLKMNEKL